MNNIKAINYGFFKIIVVFVLIFCAAVFAAAQSGDQNFPTPLTSNQLSGTIKARDIGDSRLTTYYFTFDGGQGDIFINVVTNNLNGDIDIFTVEGLRPLTKMVVYADSSDSETGRVIYLRKPEKVLMRIEGRSPNDDPATFSIKFAGSFSPSSYVAETEEPKLPEVKKESNSDVIVNSVGTIIGVKPKPTPEPKETVAENVKKEKNETIENKAEDEKITEKTESEKTEESKSETSEEIEKKAENNSDETVKETNAAEKKNTEIAEKIEKTVKPKKNREKTKKTSEPNPLENIRLVVLLKDGGKIERPISEVIKFGVEKGILTIINKDGTIARYSILDVEKVTIE